MSWKGGQTRQDPGVLQGPKVGGGSREGADGYPKILQKEPEKEPLVGLLLWQKALNSFQRLREDHKKLLSIVAFLLLPLNITSF